MLGAMKLEESSLTPYLVEHLEPLTEADPAILAEYVVALLKSDKPLMDLRKLCTDNLVEFLGDGTESFIIKLFQALDDGLNSRSGENLDASKKTELSQSSMRLEAVQRKILPAGEDIVSTNSETPSNTEEKEVSDDDDDRNHKHRRREAQPISFDKTKQEQAIRRPNRKRNNPYDNGQRHFEIDSHNNECEKEYNPSSKRDTPSKFARQHSGLVQSRAPSDLDLRTRLCKAFRYDSCLDLSTSVGQPNLDRGRGRSTPWNQHDLRFNPDEKLDFASKMASQGHRHPNVFVGTELPRGASTQTASWGSFGFMPAMFSGTLDPRHQLSWTSTFGPTIAPSLNLVLHRQRCRDFDERGFCLRGDMCPMEHGLNRIVVKDVQSLSQFNLPVSVPSSRTSGIQAGLGPLSSGCAPSGQNHKSVPSKNSKSGVTVDAPELNGVQSSDGCGADVYDPDQPLWNNECSGTSNALARLQSLKMDDEPSWVADASSYQSLGLADGSGSKHPSRTFRGNNVSESTTSVWNRIGSGGKPEMASKLEHNATTAYPGNEAKNDHEEQIVNVHPSNQVKDSCTEQMGPKLTGIQIIKRSRMLQECNGRKPLQKASRSLYVNEIPQKFNRREALLSHFQKFGRVIDIYIPLNSAKAFVQFSEREEAEAALKAPDAVMGNRFIKLSWANRDRISGKPQYCSHTKHIPSHGLAVTSVASDPSPADRGKGNLPYSAQKGSNLPAAEVLLPMASFSNNLKENGRKTVHAVQKVETLELLKDEIRKKQEMLAQKRDEFRRQLDKFEKQAISVNKGVEQAIKRPKLDKGIEVAEATTLRPSGIMGACQEGEKRPNRSSCGDIVISPTSQANSTILRQSSEDVKQTSHLPKSMPTKFKLDSRSSSFRIIPPLPVDLANDAALREHFSSFGELSSVVFEDAEVDAENADLQLSQARISFTTRHSAEKAFFGGKYWKGHSLRFMWLSIPPKSSNDCPSQEISLIRKGVLDARILSESMTSDSSLSVSCNITSTPILKEASSLKIESNFDMKCTNCSSPSVLKDLIQISQSGSTR